ncbi:hypothetical protein QYH69_34030 [Paraburkholderia sp. SARCC-3016]|uniref:hypothetical protein n=1 Tax=Paraburkholderia sp. SARCC-3016 TaxID=3058611 RepID=UPI002807EB1E|nr:hypothetical protein [Paraburkholderia sp. SARCC-3016]MDQ7982245.1 hypothetical protein [Paraburkholderia sp. SARCC-3016]
MTGKHDDLIARHIELNMSNYGPGDVDTLNAWAIEAHDAIETLRRERDEARAEVERLSAIINTPQANDFLRAVSIEAEHQKQRWGSEHDAGKTNADWNALIGYLLAKALTAMAIGNREKSEHHVITAAAVLKNWHATVTGQNNEMRPGYADGGHPGVIDTLEGSPT